MSPGGTVSGGIAGVPVVYVNLGNDGYFFSRRKHGTACETDGNPFDRFGIKVGSVIAVNTAIPCVGITGLLFHVHGATGQKKIAQAAPFRANTPRGALGIIVVHGNGGGGWRDGQGCKGMETEDPLVTLFGSRSLHCPGGTCKPSLRQLYCIHSCGRSRPRPWPN